MIVDTLDLTGEEFHRLTGWEIKPEGACKEERCVPLSPPVLDATRPIDVAVVAERLSMPIAHDETHGLWAILSESGGPESGGRVLDSARMPDLVLPDFDGEAFDIASLRGRKVLLLAWASW